MLKAFLHRIGGHSKPEPSHASERDPASRSSGRCRAFAGLPGSSGAPRRLPETGAPASYAVSVENFH